LTGWKRIAARAIVGVLAAAVAAAGLGARATTHFGAPDPALRNSRRTSLAFAGYLLRHGFRSPRPSNLKTPADLGVGFVRQILAAPQGPALEAWRIEALSKRRGTVVLFHGHAGCKASTLNAASQFRDLGFATLLVDFRGSGGSSGNATTLGWEEAQDVAAGVSHVRSTETGPIVVYGASMGAAAALKAVHDGSRPDALVLECPYDSLRTTVRHRFDGAGIVSGPIADSLLLWGRWQLGFDPYSLNPAEFASAVSMPTYLGFGARDPWVLPEEGQRIYTALRGPKRIHMFTGARHGAYADLRPDEWRADVDDFLRSQGI
jgi:alpha-beta hydrolase superfamily lysophospholipase